MRQNKMSCEKIVVPDKFDSDEGENGGCIPKRYILTLLAFFGLFSVFTMRVNLSVAMVAMVNHTVDTFANTTTPHFVECANLMTQTDTSNANTFVGEQYDWDSKTQGLILGAFFYGYVVTQIPGGFAAEKYGAKWLFGGGILITAVFTLLTPLAASLGTAAFIAVRILEGLGEVRILMGVTYPALNLIISKWSPTLERSRVSTIINTGSQIGNVVSMPISGLLSGTDLLGGWPSAFYVFGAIGCAWFILWAVFVYETPSDHPTISKEELVYIQMEKEEKTRKRAKTPWKSIFTSVPMWALIIAHCGQNFGFLMLLTELPTYLSSILHFDIKDNGLLSALPYILQAVSAWLASFIADKLRKSKQLSITSIRKLCNSIGLFGPAACLLGVTVSGCRPQLIVGLISLAMALNGFVFSGYNVTHVDMSPNFAGTLFGITNAISNLNGIIGPAVVGYFTNKGATIENWSDVFYITAAVYTVAGAVYAVFASADLQPWAEGEKPDEEEIPVKKITSDVAKY